MSKDVAFARPDHTGGRYERLLISVAREIAQGMREPQEICETHGVTPEQFAAMQETPLFRRALEDFARDVNATASTPKRVKLKAGYVLEQLLSVAYEIATDVNNPAVARAKMIETVAKIAGAMDGGGGSAGATAVGFVNIDFGLLPPAAVTVRKPDVMDLEAIEAQAAPVPDEDDALASDLLDMLGEVSPAEMVRARRLRHEALLPGHDFTPEELNTGAQPVPGFDMNRVHRRAPGASGFGAESVVQMNVATPIGSQTEDIDPEAAPAQAIEDDLLAIQI